MPAPKITTRTPVPDAGTSRGGPAYAGTVASRPSAVIAWKTAVPPPARPSWAKKWRREGAVGGFAMLKLRSEFEIQSTIVTSAIALVRALARVDATVARSRPGGCRLHGIGKLGSVRVVVEQVLRTQGQPEVLREAVAGGQVDEHFFA